MLENILIAFLIVGTIYSVYGFYMKAWLLNFFCGIFFGVLAGASVYLEFIFETGVEDYTNPGIPILFIMLAFLNGMVGLMLLVRHEGGSLGGQNNKGSQR